VGQHVGIGVDLRLSRYVAPDHRRLFSANHVYRCLVAMVVLLASGLIGANSAHAATQRSATWYSNDINSGSGCWISSPFEERGYNAPSQCDGGGPPGYLSSHAHADETGSERVALTPGVYCIDHSLAGALSHPEETNLNLGKIPSPLSSYQLGNESGSACADWSYSGEWTNYKLRCASYPTICAASEQGEPKCKPEEELCQCGFNGFLCECWNSNEACWGEYSSGLGNGEIVRATCGPAETKELAERGIYCQEEEVHPPEVSRWGFSIHPSVGCTSICDVQRYTSLTGLKDHPWGGYFGNPKLQISETSEPRRFVGAHNASGAICPLLQNEQTGGIFELCLAEWYASATGTEYGREHVICAAPGHTVDRVITLFAPGTQFATEQAGSANTGPMVDEHLAAYAAAVTTGNLINAVNADNSACAHSSPTTPQSWILLGVTSGIESQGDDAASQSVTSNVSTSYEQLPISVPSDEASEVTAEGAKLSGTIIPYGQPTNYTFQYGALLGSSTKEGSAGSGTNSVNVSATIGELLPNETYKYRIKASAFSPAETAYGPERSFITPAVAPVVETLSTGEIKATSAVLAGRVNRKNATVTSCIFEYGPTTAYGSTVPCGSIPEAPNYPVTVAATAKVSEHTGYHYRIVATNSVGTSRGADVTFTSRPYAVEDITEAASLINHTHATLNATVNPQGGLVSSCYFEYGTTTSYGTTAPCATGPGSGEAAVALSAALSGLRESTTYHYRIVATNPIATTRGADSTFTTYPTVPAVITGSAGSVLEASATLKATVNPTSANVTDCHFEYGASTSYGKTVACSTLPGAGEVPVEVIGAIKELGPSTVYHVRISSTNSFGTSHGEDHTFSTPAPSCNGFNIAGTGTSSQRIIQQTIWDPGFSTSANADACNGTQGTKQKPLVQYEPSATKQEMESWGINGHSSYFGNTNAFLGTDEPPSRRQTEEIEGHETKLIPEAIDTLPLAQEAVAIIVNLPPGCTADSKKNNGRLELNNVTLQGIFSGQITKWSEIKDDQDALFGTGCQAATRITPIVPQNGAGSTHILKMYLSLISGVPRMTESGYSRNWAQLAQGVENSNWPSATGVLRFGTTEAREVAKVAETPGSIGFANLAEVRASGYFTPSPGTGGPETARFWAPIQSNGLGTELPKFEDPASNKDVAAVGEANCKNSEYSNGDIAFPPLPHEPWNEVTTGTTDGAYPLCGFTYVLAPASYSAFSATGVEEARTVNDFLEFAINTKAEGGQKLLLKHDYEPLPKGPVLSETEKAIEKVKY
jgi:ABC-type phosphate transport system substrate-binding protein